LEAAAIDGASAWGAFWRVTIPVVRPVLLVALLFRLLDAFKLFDLVYIMTSGGPGYSTETLPFYLYQQGFSYGRYGYTAAASYLFMIGTVIIATLIIRRIGEI
jgi:multiple sugar transport system permease protein